MRSFAWTAAFALLAFVIVSVCVGFTEACFAGALVMVREAIKTITEVVKLTRETLKLIREVGEQDKEEKSQPVVEITLENPGKVIVRVPPSGTLIVWIPKGYSLRAKVPDGRKLIVKWKS